MSTATPQLIRVERVDDLPVLWASLQRLGVAELLDRHFPTHHLWLGELSLGEVVSVWLAFLLSQGDHRLCRLQPWAEQNLHTLQALLGKTVRPLDFHDDRLADLLAALAQPQPWHAFEDDLNRQTVRVYDRNASRFRLDSTTANSYAAVVSDEGLLQFGHSKDRDDLPQLKVAVAALDPLGMPVSTLVVPGNSADDPLYVPQIRQVQQAFGRGGKTYVGDCKMAALDTRASLASTQDYYLCPLSEKQLSRAQRRLLIQRVQQGEQAVQAVYRPKDHPDDEEELVAEGFAVEETMQAVVSGHALTWTERRWVVRSVAFAEGQQEQLERRLRQAQEALEQLTERKQGKRVLSADELPQAVRSILHQHRVEGVLTTVVQTTRQERTLRRYRERPEQVVVEEAHRVAIRRREEAIADAKAELGWQVYGTNELGVSLGAVVWGDRGQSQIEKGWSRLKGRPLSLTPRDLVDEDRMQGVVLLLSIALRMLTLLERVVREKLQQGGESLRGLDPGQAGRKTSRPSAELLLEAFQAISLTVVEVAGQQTALLTPLSPLQEKLLSLWDLPSDLYDRLAFPCFPEPPPVLSER